MATAEVAALLEVTAGTAVYHNHRLLTRDGHPIFVEAEWVVAARCAALVTGGAQMSPDALQRLRYSARGETADIVIRMQPVAAEDANLLGLHPDQAGIVQEHRVRDAVGQQFCYCRQVWRGELAQFSARAIVG
jgi:GntR family transcriptional regulator